MTATREETLAELVSARPALAPIFERLGLDYCCNGNRTLADACAAAGLDRSEVAAALAAVAAVAGGGDTGWTELGLVDLAEHVVATHHAYLHGELPALAALAEKVAGVHGERHPELAEVAALVHELRADLEPHLAKEERVLFPAIAALVAGRRHFPFGTVVNPIRTMTVEHDRAGELLARLRAAARGFLVPDDACASYRSLYERLEALELDTHLHVLKENHVLFPRAVALQVTFDPGHPVAVSGP